ncbi:unnamed protein product [Cyprideis torosa]|uniref:Ubiquitin carboxyl-terminal hydrolase n=1 Tax=Cyprideis torosa TaxID=163714 RepID=A0A7R8ZMZ5_9CRUS|nr:unnamed protein product [Cyprideis torosa]CAG0890244.1 unnamed protein product [Cyprideis torosa]
MNIEMGRLADGWLELESDPGLFTLLVEDFGVRGVQVDEIYDIKSDLETPVYGFIFLFKWNEARRARRKAREEAKELNYVKEEEIVNNMFFAHQIVANSCATHALLSVLLNVQGLSLGPILTKLKNHTHGMAPEDKGHSIGNTAELAAAHNQHVSHQARRIVPLPAGSTVVMSDTEETFHFVSYVPINGRVFELDGLKEFPIDHGPWNEGEDWTDRFREVIAERLGVNASGREGSEVSPSNQDIRFSLMAVIPDRRQIFETKIRTLTQNKQILVRTLTQMLEKKQGSNGAATLVRLGLHPGGKRRRRNLATLLTTVDDEGGSSGVTGEAQSQSTSSEEDAMVSNAATSGNDPCLPLDESNLTPLDERHLTTLLESTMRDLDSYSVKLKEENEKRQRFRVEDCRRTHNYDPFITTFLMTLASQGKLSTLLAQQGGGNSAASNTKSNTERTPSPSVSHSLGTRSVGSTSSGRGRGRPKKGVPTRSTPAPGRKRR